VKPSWQPTLFKMYKVLVTGSTGQLGSEINLLSSEYPYQFVFTTRDELDITNSAHLVSFIKESGINAIINCAAYTAVDKAETDSETASNVNYLAVKHLAQVAKDLKLKMIHISTDYVFDGNGHRPYLESDECKPSNIYGKTKLKGENALNETELPNSMVIRTSWVYSGFGNNFVKTMRRLGGEREGVKVVGDQAGSPTYARDLARCILDLLPQIENTKTETYHYSNEGICSWYDFALAIMEFSKLDCLVLPIPSSQYPTPASRPFYSVMSKEKIKADYQLQIPHWRTSLQNCIGEMDQKNLLF